MSAERCLHPGCEGARVPPTARCFDHRAEWTLADLERLLGRLRLAAEMADLPIVFEVRRRVNAALAHLPRKQRTEETEARLTREVTPLVLAEPWAEARLERAVDYLQYAAELELEFRQRGGVLDPPKGDSDVSR